MKQFRTYFCINQGLDPNPQHFVLYLNQHAVVNCLHYDKFKRKMRSYVQQLTFRIFFRHNQVFPYF